MKTLDAGEYPLRKIFSSDFEFTIPDYQRPYSWGKEQALQLLDDLEGSLVRDAEDPYFLGSIVLVKEPGSPRSEVIDGQQRLTTLSIVLAVLRDLTDDPQLRSELGEFVLEPGKITAGTMAKPRLTLRHRDASFFKEYVQSPGRIAVLCEMADKNISTDAQKSLRDNAKVIFERLASWSDEKRMALAAMLGIRTFLVVVATPDLTSAHRIFSVMNARGLDLTAADIFKSKVIGDIDEASQALYADKWEQEEQDLGRDGFAELFQHVRMVFAKDRPRREVLLEFDQQVLAHYLPGNGAAFIDDVLIPYSDAYEHLVTQNYPHDREWKPVNEWLARLMQVDNSDWRPPALWALKNHGDDPIFLDKFLRRLERLAASMLIRRVYATPRATIYANVLKQLESGLGLEAPALDLDEHAKEETRARLGADIYLVNAVRKYVLLRLDELLANQPGVSYQHKMITVEHVLPQNPKDDSQWLVDFPDEVRALWTHKLANLVLLNRAKNSEAQRYDFPEKKRRYFTGPNGVAIFAVTSQVLSHDAWTPEVLSARQASLLSRLFAEWSLD